MSDEFRTEVETQELIDKLLREIFSCTEYRQEQQENFQILLTLNYDFLMKVKMYATPGTFLFGADHTLHGWPYLEDVKQKEPYKVWSRHL